MSARLDEHDAQRVKREAPRMKVGLIRMDGMAWAVVCMLTKYKKGMRWVRQGQEGTLSLSQSPPCYRAMLVDYIAAGSCPSFLIVLPSCTRINLKMR